MRTAFNRHDVRPATACDRATTTWPVWVIPGKLPVTQRSRNPGRRCGPWWRGDHRGPDASAFPGQETTDDNSTLVEFTLTPEGDATRLRMVESGFARLEIPEERLPYASHESHSEGWTEVLDTMRKYAEQQSA